MDKLVVSEISGNRLTEFGCTEDFDINSVTVERMKEKIALKYHINPTTINIVDLQ